MSNLVKIIPLPFEAILDKNDYRYFSIANQLAVEKMTQFPSTVFSVMPERDRRTKRFKTGLDEEALEINNIPHSKTRETEKKRIKELKEHLEKVTSLNLDPYTKDPSKPCYYDLLIRGEDNNPLGFVFKNPSQGEVFDLDNPIHHITYLWLLETGVIVKSYADYESGNYNSVIAKFIIDNVEEEAIQKAKRYKIKMEAQQALFKFNGSPNIYKLAEILRIPYSYKDKADVVFVSVAEYVDYVDNSDLQKFVNISKMPAAQFDAEYYSLKFLKEGVCTEYAGGLIRRGTDEYGEHLCMDGIEGLKSYLLSPSNSAAYAEMRQELEDKIEAYRISK